MATDKQQPVDDLVRELARLKAENERLTKERDAAIEQWAVMWKELPDTAERALSERAGAVKVKAGRHENKDRNVILNTASTDLERIINGHDPEVSILANDVWDRLDKMACEIETLTTEPVAPEDELPYVCDACTKGDGGTCRCDPVPEERQEAAAGPKVKYDGTGADAIRNTPAAFIERAALDELRKSKTAMTVVCSGLLNQPFGDKVPLYTRPAEQAVTEAATNALMYLQTGFIECDRCGHEVETKTLDAVHELTAALAQKEEGR